MIVNLATERVPSGTTKHQATDMKSILGYLNQGEWTSKLSIGSIMQLQPYKIKDLIEEGQGRSQTKKLPVNRKRSTRDDSDENSKWRQRQCDQTLIKK